MRRFIFATIGVFVALLVLSSCKGDGIWDTYQQWRIDNEDWYKEQLVKLDDDGNLYYRPLSPSWNVNSGVLIHYFNDRSLTEGNLSPLQTSTISCKYHLQLYNGEGVDSSYNMTDSLYTSVLADNIAGWQVALNDMRVGDSCAIVVPYSQGYGTSGSSAIDPFSMLLFHVKLVDIPYYEVPNPN